MKLSTGAHALIGILTPVDVKAVGDDPDPHARIGKPPEGIGRGVDDRHPSQDPAFGDRVVVEALELLAVQPPFSEVPGPFQGKVVEPAAEFLGNHRAEGVGVVATHPIEVYAEDVWTVQGSAGREAAIDGNDGAVHTAGLVGCHEGDHVG